MMKYGGTMITLLNIGPCHLQKYNDCHLYGARIFNIVDFMQMSQQTDQSV